MKLTIPASSLRELPAGATFHRQEGRASLTIGSDAEGNIVAEASCDSLQRLVWLYEEELTRMQAEMSERESNDERTEKKRGMPPWLMLAVGAVAGIILTIKLKRQ